MSGEILPPREPIVTGDMNVTQPWYRYFVSRKRITDALSDYSSLVVGAAPGGLPNARGFAVEAPITAVDGGPGQSYTVGLADSGVTADTYGEATKLVVLAIDAKGRVTAASEIALNSDNVTEGGTNLFFTNTRARAAVSGSSGIDYNGGTGDFTLNQPFARGLFSGAGRVNYNNGTGVIDTNGFSGTVSPPLSLTFVNGVCTAAT